MAALETVPDYVKSARGLLLDTVEPYRYPDADFVEGLNFALLQARRLRPDLFLVSAKLTLRDAPSYSASDTSAVDIDPQYRLALLYYIAGHVQLQDTEDVQDSRAAAFLQKSNNLFLAIG